MLGFLAYNGASWLLLKPGIGRSEAAEGQIVMMFGAFEGDRDFVEESKSCVFGRKSVGRSSQGLEFDALWQPLLLSHLATYRSLIPSE